MIRGGAADDECRDVCRAQPALQISTNKGAVYVLDDDRFAIKLGCFFFNGAGRAGPNRESGRVPPWRMWKIGAPLLLNAPKRSAMQTTACGLSRRLPAASHSSNARCTSEDNKGAQAFAGGSRTDFRICTAL
jgi:hypothetical protein